MTTENDKPIRLVLRDAPGHWVGDGFPVRTLFSYPEHGEILSPFLMMDYAGPKDFPPSEQRRGVSEHPHRGFETVTIVYSGEVEHRDSAGGGGVIGPGDVQWMTAASGLVHEEFHGPHFACEGGRFEMVQLWVNLPARYKMTAPRYQSIGHQDIPCLDIPGGGGRARVIAGALADAHGPAQTYSPMQVWDLRLDGQQEACLSLADSWQAVVVVLQGQVQVQGTELLDEACLAILDRSGRDIRLLSQGPATVLLLAGEPLDEPIVGSGPFVMNTAEEIRQAMIDYQSGRMGRLGE